MKFGVGRWREIIRSGCLPGKTPSQLSLQCQRMLGQQSLGEFMSIHLDSDVIFEKNSKIEGLRKNGCLINSGKTQTTEERQKKIKRNIKQYEISQSDIEAVVIPDLNKQDAVKKKETVKEFQRLRARLKQLQNEKRRRAEILPASQTVQPQSQGYRISINSLLNSPPITEPVTEPPTCHNSQRPILPLFSSYPLQCTFFEDGRIIRFRRREEMNNFYDNWFKYPPTKKRKVLVPAPKTKRCSRKRQSRQRDAEEIDDEMYDDCDSPESTPSTVWREKRERQAKAKTKKYTSDSGSDNDEDGEEKSQVLIVVPLASEDDEEYVP